MRKIHEVLRPHFARKLAAPDRRKIRISQSTVNEYLTRFQQPGIALQH